MKCTCGRIKVGSTVTESRNWNPECVEHGVDSAWWNTPERQEKQRVDNLRLRDLQQQARDARRKAQ